MKYIIWTILVFNKKVCIQIVYPKHIANENLCQYVSSTWSFMILFIENQKKPLPITGTDELIDIFMDALC